MDPADQYNFFGPPGIGSHLNSATSVSSEGCVIVSGLESSMQLVQSAKQGQFLPESQRDLSLSRPDNSFGGISGIRSTGDTLLLVQPVLPASPRERASSQVSQLVPFGPQQKAKLALGMKSTTMKNPAGECCSVFGVKVVSLWDCLMDSVIGQ